MLVELRRRFSGGTLTRKVAVNTVAQVCGRVFAGVVGVVSVVATTRYLSIQDVGTLLTAFTFASLFLVGAQLGVSAAGARMLAWHPEETRRLVASIALISTLLSLLLAGCGYLAAHMVYPGAEHSLLRSAILVFLLQLLPNGPKVAAASLLVARQRIVLQTLSGVVSRALSLALVLAAIARDGGLLWVAAATASAAILDGCISAALALRIVGVGRPSLRTGLTVLKAAVPLGAILLINIFYFRLDLLLLSLLSSRQEVAFYGVSYKLIDFLFVLPSMFMVTLFPVVARLEPTSERLHALVQKAFTTVQLAALPVIVLGLYAGDILEVLGGSSYRTAAPILQLLLVSLGLSFLPGVLGNVLVALNRQRGLLVVSCTVLASNVALNLVLIPALDATGAAIVMVMTESLSLAAVLWLYSHVAKRPSFYKPRSTLLAAVAMALVMAVRFVPGLPAAGPLAAAIIGAAGFGAYLVVLYKLRALPEFALDRAPLRRFRQPASVEG